MSESNRLTDDGDEEGMHPPFREDDLSEEYLLEQQSSQNIIIQPMYLSDTEDTPSPLPQTPYPQVPFVFGNSPPSPAPQEVNELPKPPPRRRVYQPESTGPWVVYIRSKMNGKSPNVISIARDLDRSYPSVISYQPMRPHKMRIVVGSLKEANAIACDPKFTIEYRVYVPARDVEIDGVVTEEGLTVDDLVNSGVGRFKDPGLPTVKVLDARQLKSASGEGEERTFSLSNSYRVTFSGTALPDYVAIGKVRLPVRLYVPSVMFCQNCKQLDHTAAYCCNQARCSKCGEKHAEASCEIQAVSKCLYCTGEESHALSACPKYISRREKIKTSLKTRSKKSYRDMLMKSLPIVSENQFGLLSEYESEGEDPCEGTSAGPFVKKNVSQAPKRKRTTNTQPRLAASKVNKTKNPQSGNSNSTPPIQKPPGLNPSPKDFPPLSRKSKPQTSLQNSGPSVTNKDVTIPRETASDPSSNSLPSFSSDGKMKFSEIVSFILDFFSVPAGWRTMINMFVPLLREVLKKKACTMTLIAEAISFDE